MPRLSPSKSPDPDLDYLRQLPGHIDTLAITREHERLQRWVNQDKKGFLRFREPFLQASHFPATTVDCSGDTVIIGRADELAANDRERVAASMRAFMPWRKGPFSVYGIDIDAEWRSEQKWNRLQTRMPDLREKVVGDIGCNNGYYMFRMAHHQPRLVLGFEPSVQHYYCFKALNGMARLPNLHIDLLGVEHLELFPDCFDVLFLMGIIYHRPSPIDVLRDIYQALRANGTLILESQAIPGNDPIALFPESTYAKVPGTYFVPTGSCLCNWMARAGFQDVEIFSVHAMSAHEQRTTDWMTFESFSDFMDPARPDLTIEGYPAPLRILVSGRKSS